METKMFLRENAVVTKVFCSCVFCLFLPVLCQKFLVQIDLGTRLQGKDACWAWEYTERRGWILGLRLIPLKRDELPSLKCIRISGQGA